MKVLFNFVSFVFHPLLVTIQVVLLLYHTNQYVFGQEYDEKNLVLLFLLTFCYPMFMILLMKPIGFISSYQMHDKKERIGPLMIAIVFYVWTYMSVKSTSFPILIQAFILGSVIALSMAFVINNFQKISLHMVGMGGLFFEILLWLNSSTYDYSYIFLGAVILVGLVATARLYLDAHSIGELYTGFLVGITGQILATVFVF